MIQKAWQKVTVDKDRSIILIARIRAPDDANWFRVGTQASDLAREAYQVLAGHFGRTKKAEAISHNDLGISDS